MRLAIAAALLTGAVAMPGAHTMPPAQERTAWGGQPATVTRDGNRWTIAGRTSRVTLNASTLAIDVHAGAVQWTMTPSASRDLIVRRGARDVTLRLADAATIAVAPYDPGFKTGVKIALSGFHDGRMPLDVSLFLTLALEGRHEDLTFDAAAAEGTAAVRELNWPPALDARDVDYTVLNNGRGILLPRAWPSAYNPVRPGNAATDTSEIESHLIESWSMPWWGFMKGPAAMMVIVDTPDDAAYQFEHPAGGPTVIGPRWRASLGRFRYPRAGRFCFFERGNYVDLAKRYRREAIESGLFVALKEKAARSPGVAALIGTPQTRLGILRNLKPDSDRYDTAHPEKNRSLTTYDDRIRQLHDLHARGVDRLHVVLTGWPNLGYDRQHPDGWPPPPEAGGWDGLKRFADALKALGYLFSIHDQYRDYYVDAPSWHPEFAVHEEDDTSPPHAFPGTRFGLSKDGAIPFMRHWDGGRQSFLTPRLMPGHLQKNYALLFDHGIRPDGSYLDVFGYVPPDEDFNPEHPATRTESIRARAACYTWVRANLGLVGTEAAVDWVIPYVDYSSPLRAGRAGIPVPLFELVYHDAIITPYAPGDLRGFLDAGLPQVGVDDFTASADRIRAMAALERRLAFAEMTGHEFLDANHRRERSTFADGTTITVDWDANTFTIKP